MVTYHGNNYMEEGERNLYRMKDEFDFDHIIFRPSTNILKKLNILGLKITSDELALSRRNIFIVTKRLNINSSCFWGSWFH